MRSTPGVDLIKAFRHKFTHTFCKLGHFIIVSYFFGNTKRSSLQISEYNYSKNVLYD
jgi:hypothetical protein